jgi:hypothetical protein
MRQENWRLCVFFASRCHSSSWSVSICDYSDTLWFPLMLRLGSVESSRTVSCLSLTARSEREQVGIIRGFGWVNFQCFTGSPPGDHASFPTWLVSGKLMIQHHGESLTPSLLRRFVSRDSICPINVKQYRFDIPSNGPTALEHNWMSCQMRSWSQWIFLLSSQSQLNSWETYRN